MGVILGKSPYPGQTVQFAALLIAIYGSKLCQPHRQLFVGPWSHLVYLAMMRTVHGF